MLRRPYLPATPHQQAEIYAEAARARRAGSRFEASGYGLVGVGNYNEHDTIAGAAHADDMFLNARAGLRANYRLEAQDTINLSLDYRFRRYDDSARRDDSDLRWNANISHDMASANIALGVRG